MVSILGGIIEEKPMHFIVIIIVITIFLSSFITGLEFNTDFNDFTPEDPLVQASIRINEYFGSNQQILIIRALAENENNIISSNSLKELSDFQKKLQKNDNILSTLSITTFIDNICLIEFGKSLENCTDDQIKTAINDLLNYEEINELTILQNDDNQDSDIKNSLDIINSEIIKNEEKIILKINLYDLSEIYTELYSNPGIVNITEWFIEFENQISPDPSFKFNYKISVQIAFFKEQKQIEWTLFKGFFRNIKEIRNIIESQDQEKYYTIKPYIWIEIPDENIEIPIPLKETNIIIDTSKNTITLQILKSELGKYGISTKIESFEVPAKLTNFTIGTRYSQTPEYVYDLTKRFEDLQTNIISDFFSVENFEDFENMSNQEFNFSSISDNFFEYGTEWINLDKAPDSGSSSNIFYLFPPFIIDLKNTALSFISKEYQYKGISSKALIFAEIKSSNTIDESVTQTEELLEMINELDEENPNLVFNATGPGVLSVEINEVTGDANQIIGPSIFIIIILVLFISFRKPSYVLIAILSLVISSLWLFGTMALLNIPFNVIAVALFPVVLGLGVDYSVHLFHSYKTELIKGKTPGEAIRLSVDETGTAMFLAMVTTVIAFISFLSATIPPVRDFGILLAIGVIYTFITAITFSAPLRYIIDKRKKVKINFKTSRIGIINIMKITSRIVLCHQKKIFALMILISLSMFIGASQIETGFDFDQFIPGDTPSLEIQDQIAEDFPFSSQNQEYILIEGDIATVLCLKGISKTYENMDDDTHLGLNVDGSVKASSIMSMINEAVDNNRSLVNIFNLNENYIPKSDKDVRLFFNYLKSNEEFESSFRSLIHENDNDYNAALIRVYIDPSLETKEGNVNDELQLLKQELNDDVDEFGNASAVVTGNFIVTLTITDSLTTSQVTSTIISIILATLVVIIVYKNPLLGLIAIIPVGVSMLWILGTMFYIGYSLNILTITVTSITIGIGIDYAIHATQRFRFTADRTGDFRTSVCETISQTGGALLIAALTTTLGFGILVFAPIPPQQQFGLILAITIIYSFLTSVLLLPIILYNWGDWRKRRKGYIISPKKYNQIENDFDNCECEKSSKK
jgi:predicted RND superfamily exporter protein